MSDTASKSQAAETSFPHSRPNQKDPQVVLVSGAAGGIGRELVRRFINDGARVVATDIDLARLRELEHHLGQTANLTTLQCDVASEQGCRELAVAVSQKFGHLDVLVNNAGLFPVVPFESMSYAMWRDVITTNLDSVFLMVHACLPLLKKSTHGRIVNVGSGSFFKGNAGQAHYVSAKGGVVGFTRALAWELGDYGINVNMVTPGLTTTPAAINILPAAAIAARRTQRPLKRDQHAGDVVGAVIFLAGPDADFMTGQIVNVDGGTYMH